MSEEISTTTPTIRLATSADVDIINQLDHLSQSPTREIHRDMEKYFGSIDPSTHEHTFIFLAEIVTTPVGKAELMLPPPDSPKPVGYVKRVVVDPNFRGHGLASLLMRHIIRFASTEYHLESIDLHVWEHNASAIRLYEKLGFVLQHRELYYKLPLETSTP